MAQRSVCSATICLGLVAIPVKFYTSASAERVQFNLITPNGNRVNKVSVDAVLRTNIKDADCLSGYEYAKGQYVTFTDEELDAMRADPNKKDTIDLPEFVPADTVDMMHVEKSYHIGPDKGGDKAYLLLADVLKRSNKVGVGKWYVRNREHLVTIASHGDGLVVHQMFYADEIRTFNNPCKKLELANEEIEMGMKLIEMNSKPRYDNSKYTDGFVQEVAKAVERKVNGGTIEVGEVTKAAPVTDLFAALKASLTQKPEAKVG